MVLKTCTVGDSSVFRTVAVVQHLFILGRSLTFMSNKSVVVKDHLFC